MEKLQSQRVLNFILPMSMWKLLNTTHLGGGRKCELGAVLVKEGEKEYLKVG